MAIESELKFRVRDFSAIRKRLKQLGAKRISSYFEHNTLFRAPQGFTLRLRKKHGKGILTLKGPLLPGAVKRREEIEAAVSYPQAFQTLRALGIRFVYEKRREEWKFKNAVIALDALPILGKVIEIEAAPAAVKTVAKKLGLKNGTKASYIDLFKKAKPGKKRFTF